MALGAPVSALTYVTGSFICHQRADRSFHIRAAQVPVCARCLGLYVGAVVGAAGALWRRRPPAGTGLKTRPYETRSYETRFHESGPGDRLRLLLVIAALPTALTWGSEMAGWWGASNQVRFLAALPLGAAVALTVNYLECARPRRIGSKPPLTRI